MTLSERADVLAEAIGAAWDEGFREKEMHNEAMEQFRAIIEECALVAQDYWRVRSGNHTESVYDAIAAAIRALKDK